jgi:hypothetical protein
MATRRKSVQMPRVKSQPAKRTRRPRRSADAGPSIATTVMDMAAPSRTVVAGRGGFQTTVPSPMRPARKAAKAAEKPAPSSRPRARKRTKR